MQSQLTVAWSLFLIFWLVSNVYPGRACKTHASVS